MSVKKKEMQYVGSVISDVQTDRTRNIFYLNYSYGKILKTTFS